MSDPEGSRSTRATPTARSRKTGSRGWAWGAFTATLATLVLGGVVVLPAPQASAHSGQSIITLSAAKDAGAVRVTAKVVYLDGDAVKGEDLVGIAYAPTTGNAHDLHLAPTADPGSYTVTEPLEAGPWKVEVDAVTRTRGLQSIGFTVTPEGEVVNFQSPSPLPAGLKVPSALRPLTDGAPAARGSRGLVLAVTGGAGVVIVFILLAVRRRTSADRAGSPGAAPP
ncbi:MAG: hypothetical protein ABI692_06495 [Terracoccus sp.]